MFFRGGVTGRPGNLGGRGGMMRGHAPWLSHRCGLAFASCAATEPSYEPLAVTGGAGERRAVEQSRSVSPAGGETEQMGESRRGRRADKGPEASRRRKRDRRRKREGKWGEGAKAGDAEWESRASGGPTNQQHLRDPNRLGAVDRRVPCSRDPR